ncbi:MAG TPA: FAD-dependent oxidoreductase [Pseudonocardia sp.]
MHIVVVGAGLGGLAAALGVHRAGHEVTVLERAPEPRETGAGIGIPPNGVLALDALGLGEPVRARAVPRPPTAGRAPARRSRTLWSSGTSSPERTPRTRPTSRSSTPPAGTVVRATCNELPAG